MDLDDENLRRKHHIFRISRRQRQLCVFVLILDRKRFELISQSFGKIWSRGRVGYVERKRLELIPGSLYGLVGVVRLRRISNLRAVFDKMKLPWAVKKRKETLERLSGWLKFRLKHLALRKLKVRSAESREVEFKFKSLSLQIDSIFYLRLENYFYSLKRNGLEKQRKKIIFESQILEAEKKGEEGRGEGVGSGGLAVRDGGGLGRQGVVIQANIIKNNVCKPNEIFLYSSWILTKLTNFESLLMIEDRSLIPLAFDFCDT